MAQLSLFFAAKISFLFKYFVFLNKKNKLCGVQSTEYRRVSYKSEIQNTLKRASVLIIALALSCVYSAAQKRSIHQNRVREAVAIDCDTALTSDLRKVRRPYRFTDNLFWGANYTGYRVVSEAGNRQDILTMMRSGGELMIGKYFSPWISGSLNLGYQFQQECVAALSDGTYSFHSAAVSAEAQLCVNRFFSRYRADEKFLTYLVAGGGMQAAFGFADVIKPFSKIVDSNHHFSPFYRTGLMFEWRVGEGTSLTARGLWSANTSALCGMKGDHNHHGVELSVGFVSRLLNHYGSRSFQNCRGNEIYYFRMLEDRLLKDHQQQQKLYLKGKDEAPDMTAEQDSVLIFPYGYPYLTKRQEAKLDSVAQRLMSDPGTIVDIDLYPIVFDDPKMTPAQSVQRCEDAIRNYLLHCSDQIKRTQIHFVPHFDQQSPVPNQSIWIHGAFLHCHQ